MEAGIILDLFFEVKTYTFAKRSEGETMKFNKLHRQLSEAKPKLVAKSEFLDLN